MKNIFKKTALLLLLLSFIACKKNTAHDPDLSPKAIFANDLADYYLVSQLKLGNSQLALIYFTSEGGVLKATLHLMGATRTVDAVVNNSSFSFDYNNDGQGVFTFELEKDVAGLLKLKSYKYVNKNNLEQGLVYAIMAKKTEAQVFTNSSFKTGNLLFKLNAENLIEWDIKLRQTGTNVINGQPIPIFSAAPEFTKLFYSVNNIAFKADVNEFFGISVPRWNGSVTTVMLLERPGTAIMLCTKQ